MVNIIIPFYNSQASLNQTLASVEAQTYSKWSVILIDDGSTDSSQEIATEFLKRNVGKAKLIQSLKPKSGPAVGRNQALQHAKGEYLVYLDSDDLLAPFCLEQRVTVMQNSPDLDWAVFNQYQCSPGENSPSKIFNMPAKTKEDATELFFKMFTPWQTMAPIWKTDVIRKIGGFNEILYPSEDPDLHLRALLNPDLKIKIMSQLPPDCIYFVGNKTEDRVLSFYRESICSKFLFLKSWSKYLGERVSSKQIKLYKKFIRQGYYRFIISFLLSRFKEHRKQFEETSVLMRDMGILYTRDAVFLKSIFRLFTSDSALITKLRVRGLVFRLLLKRRIVLT